MWARRHAALLQTGSRWESHESKWPGWDEATWADQVRIATVRFLDALCDDGGMRKAVILAALFVAFSEGLSSKDKNVKVPFHEMALGMRDAFNCGLVVEQRLHGRLKDDADGYSKERAANNCDHVESVLNTLNDQDGANPNQ